LIEAARHRGHAGGNLSRSHGKACRFRLESCVKSVRNQSRKAIGRYGKNVELDAMKKFARRGFFLCALLMAWGPDALAATFNITANTNWSAIAGGPPTATDSVIVKNGANLTVNVANAVCQTIQVGSNTAPNGNDGTLTFNSGSQLTVSGAVTFGDASRAGSIIMTNGGTLIAQSVVVTGINTWTPGTGTLILTATSTLPNNTNFDTFNNVTLNGGTTTLSRTTTVNGTLTVASGATMANGGNALTDAGNFVLNGTLSGTGTTTLSGSGTTIDGTGSVTSTGTFTLGTGNKTILSTADLDFAGTIAINGARTITNNGIITTTTATLRSCG